MTDKLKHFCDSVNFLARGYTLKLLPDGKYWVMENLREEVEGAIWHEKYNCFMYTWEQALKVVPPGFHLPTSDEFLVLCKSVGFEKDDDKTVIKRLINECGFIPFSRTNTSLRYHGYWWSSTQRNAAFACDFFFDSSSVKPQSFGDKGLKFAVRLIKN